MHVLMAQLYSSCKAQPTIQRALAASARSPGHTSVDPGKSLALVSQCREWAVGREWVEQDSKGEELGREMSSLESGGIGGTGATNILLIFPAPVCLLLTT